MNEKLRAPARRALAALAAAGLGVACPAAVESPAPLPSAPSVMLIVDDPLVSAISGPPGPARREALLALHTLDDDAALIRCIDPLFAVLAEGGLPQAAAGTALHNIVQRARRELPYSDAIVAEPGLYERLCERRTSTDQQVRLHAVRMLGLFGGRASGPLIESLGDEWHFIRAHAARSLEELGPDAIPAVDALLEQASRAEDPVERAAAASALAKMGPLDASLVPRVVPLLDDEGYTRTYAVMILGNMGPPAAEAAAWSVLQIAKSSEIYHTRGYAFEALGKMQAPVALHHLVRVLEQRHKQERRHSAALGLGGLVNVPSTRNEAIAALLWAARDTNAEVAKAAIDALGGVEEPPPSVTRALAEAAKVRNKPFDKRHLRDADISVRWAALDYLQEQDGPPPVELIDDLLPLLDSADSSMIEQTAALILRLDARGARAIAERVLAQPSRQKSRLGWVFFLADRADDEHPRVVDAVVALTRLTGDEAPAFANFLGRQGAAAALVRLLADNHSCVRWSAVLGAFEVRGPYRPNLVEALARALTGGGHDGHCSVGLQHDDEEDPEELRRAASVRMQIVRRFARRGDPHPTVLSALEQTVAHTGDEALRYEARRTLALLVAQAASSSSVR